MAHIENLELFLHRRRPAAIFAPTGGSRNGAAPPWPPSGKRATFPRRPDDSGLNRAIALFYVGRNQNGFWVVREASARSGGLFLFERSALRFVRNSSAPAACAIMLIDEFVELDIANGGNPLVAWLEGAMTGGARRAPRSPPSAQPRW